MKTSELAAIRQHREEMLDSYLESIREVGGDSKMFLENIDTLTISEMMDLLAQNGVRFTAKNSKNTGRCSQDWRTWKSGDVVEYLGGCPDWESEYFTEGSEYSVCGVNVDGGESTVSVEDNDDDSLWMNPKYFKKIA